MKTRFIFSILFSMLFVSVVGAVAGPLGAAAAGAASLMPRPKNVTLMAVTPEIWTDYIVGNLFKDNEFLLQSVDESQYVIGTGVVHIPQAGAPSGVERNRKTLPATITRRKDIDVTYVLDEFTTDPRFIPNIDQAELSYDKMDSCMMEDMAYMKQFVAEAMMYNWRPTHFLLTTGDSKSAHLGTGNRKAICVEDFIKAKEAFNQWGVPKSGRVALISTAMMGQLVRELKANANRDYSVIYNAVTGEIDKLEGFKLKERQNTLVASAVDMTQVSGKTYYNWTTTDNTYTPEEYLDREAGNAAFATTSAEIAILWHPTMVARALGDTKMFDDMGNPQYYGDIYSFLQRAGGRKKRGDGKGVIGIIQDTP
jgi:hypothetical protein